VANETPNVVECKVQIDARPETVFQYLTDPDRIARWLGPVQKLDARPGGEIKIGVATIYSGSGTIVEIDPPRRLVYTWGWDEPGHPIPSGSTRVEVDVTPDGAGSVVQLRHLGLPLDAIADHTNGWQHFLDRLAIAGAGGDPGPDPAATPKAQPTPATRS
jgi:uncharacterized protein YndB with AHSA1/START domain